MKIDQIGAHLYMERVNFIRFQLIPPFISMARIKFSKSKGTCGILISLICLLSVPALCEKANADDLSSARKLLNQSKYVEATRAFEKVVAAESKQSVVTPNYLGALWGIALAKFELGEFDNCVQNLELYTESLKNFSSSEEYNSLNSAVKRYKPSLYTDINHLRDESEARISLLYNTVNFKIGISATQAKDWTRAITSLSKIGSDYKDYSPTLEMLENAYYFRGQYYLSENRLEDAYDDLVMVSASSEFFLSSVNALHQVAYKRASRSYQSGKWDLALSSLKDIPKDSPSFSDGGSLRVKVLHSYSEELFQKKKWQRAITLLEEEGSPEDTTPEAVTTQTLLTTAKDSLLVESIRTAVADLDTTSLNELIKSNSAGKFAGLITEGLDNIYFSLGSKSYEQKNWRASLSFFKRIQKGTNIYKQSREMYTNAERRIDQIAKAKEERRKANLLVKAQREKKLAELMSDLPRTYTGYGNSVLAHPCKLTILIDGRFRSQSAYFDGIVLRGHWKIKNGAIELYAKEEDNWGDPRHFCTLHPDASGNLRPDFFGNHLLTLSYPKLWKKR